MPNTQRHGRRIAMTDAERDDYLATERVCRVATVGPDGRPHVVPLWYAWEPTEPALWLYSLVRSRRWADLRADPRVSVVVDSGSTYDELRGVELTGAVEVVGEAPRAGAPVPALVMIERLFAARYSQRESVRYDGRHAWLRLRPDTIVSWDFRKIAAPIAAGGRIRSPLRRAGDGSAEPLDPGSFGRLWTGELANLVEVGPSNHNENSTGQGVRRKFGPASVSLSTAYLAGRDLVGSQVKEQQVQTSLAVSPRTRWAPWVFAGVGTAWALLYAANVLGPLEQATFLITGLATFGAIVYGLHRFRPRPLWPWLCIVGALLLFLVAGAARLDLNTLGNLTRTRSLLPDAVAIPGYLLLATGLTRLARPAGGNRSASIDMVLEAIVASLAVFACAWIFMIDPILFRQGSPLTVRIMLACYPPLSVFLVLIAFRIGFDPTRRRVPAAQFLIVAMLAMLVGDTIYMFADLGIITVSSSLIDLPYLLAFVAFGANVLHPSMASLTKPSSMPVTRSPSMGRLGLLAVALVIPAAIAADTQERGTSDRIAVATIIVVLTCAVAIRLFRALRSSDQATEDMAHRATHDVLTGLPNRSFIEAYVDDRLSEPGDPQLALLFVDVDRFKDVNDTLGHSFGDELLIQVGRRLSSIARPADVVGRIGGDEFVVVLNQVTSVEEARSAAERVRDVFHSPFAVRHSRTHVFASVACAFAERSIPMTTAETLIGDADNAMYQAKGAGRNTVAVFDTTMRERVEARRSIEQDLQDALERKEFTLDYQPIVDLASGRVTGFESLLRWSRGPDELVPPVIFIPIAEQTGLIIEIGAWVIEESVRQLASWRGSLADAENLRISVNLSAAQLRDPELINVVSRSLATHGLPGTALSMELTETVLMDNLASSLATLDELRSLGVGLSIDDFGTGYSSLAYLKRLPVDSVKIDQAFINDLERDDTSEETIVAAIVAMAHALGIITVAEGVETITQEVRLRGLECDQAQGYYYAHPVHAVDVPRTLEEVSGRSRLRLVKDVDQSAS